MTETTSRTELPLIGDAVGCRCCVPEPLADSVLGATGGGGRAFTVEGLTCGHCVQSVKDAVLAIDGVLSVSIDLVVGGRSPLVIGGAVDRADAGDAVTAAGYTLTSI
ncbi:heavy-metal-associated domain-containing protein [Pseudarthrobacter sp. PS3-L1]|uniref:heavy-metal-associated domain-containing protein n=1 Tax=Pseudarthrobacter sp. PS3-L1 TaxID=3046207 RepID=UPI0024BABDA5|nr:heavy-metal-associated domain-containing protein [Pseudarthrobacter sp. PS3-L1]MDJ0318936.1 heavy-metal-associated domain-containing protein [Pseudarthrobacter sp. PS3-L1]